MVYAALTGAAAHRSLEFSAGTARLMDLVDFGRYAAGLLITLGLLAGLGWGAKRLDLLSSLRGERAGRRLAVVETLPVDARRRLAVLRWDGREHLVLMGMAGDVLLESREAAPAPAASSGPAPSSGPETEPASGPAESA